MKSFYGFLALLLLSATESSAQNAADYYTPLQLGQYVTLQTVGPVGAGWSERRTTYTFEGHDMITGNECFREKAYEVVSNSVEQKIFRIFWIRRDGTGNLWLGAMSTSDSPNPDSAMVVNALWFPNEFLTKGYSRTYPYGNLTGKDSVISITESVSTPFGQFENCLKLAESHIDSTGAVIFREYHYYALGIGLVKNERTIPAAQFHTDELIGYGTSIHPALSEFPIATGVENIIGGGGAFNGTTFLFALTKYLPTTNDIGFQRVTSEGNLTGPPVFLGKNASNPIVASDGVKFCMLWTDSTSLFGSNNSYETGKIYAQMIDENGVLTGPTVIVASDVNIRGGGRVAVLYGDTTYFVTYLKGGYHVDHLYGQRMSRSGILLGAPVQISTEYARENAVAYDGTNFLAAWCKVDQPNVDKDIVGQFVSPAGVPVGQNFLIDGSDNASDNPVTLSYNGKKYLVAFHDQSLDLPDTRWNMIGRFVTPAGTIGERFMICDSSHRPTFATSAYDGEKYLITWMELSGKSRVKGRLFSDAGVPMSDPFIIFDTLGNKSVMGGVGGFGDGNFVLTATRMDSSFGSGDVYGMFLNLFTTGISEEQHPGTVRAYVLDQNYPNPFNPATTIRLQLQQSGFVTLTIFDALGREVRTLVNEYRQSGEYSFTVHADGLSSGIYFYTVRVNGSAQTRKMVLLR